MLLGTASGVGKSTFTAGLCRIFARDGYKTAPFKAVNMSNNAYVMKDGKQIASSQQIAAFACHIEPEPIMNPVLLTPSENGTKVILMGEDIGLMKDFDYKKIKSIFEEKIMESYLTLSSKYEIIVVEGAGSPVEMNLKKDDIVNLNLAKKIHSPFLLISDISRGGAFASIYGTKMLLDEEEEMLFKGMIINKFSGDIDSFTDGIKIIENLTKKKVFGVMPAIKLQIEDEDSVFDNVIKTRESISSDNAITNTDEYNQYLDNQIDYLADEIQKNIDINEIYTILEMGK